MRVGSDSDRYTYATHDAAMLCTKPNTIEIQYHCHTIEGIWVANFEGILNRHVNTNTHADNQ